MHTQDRVATATQEDSAEDVNTMKVGMIGWEFPPFLSGGLGVHCYELTHCLANLGVQLDFFMPAIGKKLDVGHPNLRIFQVAETDLSPYLKVGGGLGRHMVKNAYFTDLFEAVRIYNDECFEFVSQFDRVEHYDFIHCHDWLTFQAGMRLKRELGKKLIVTVHSTEYDRNTCPDERILAIEKLGVAAADMVITVSKRMKALLMSRFAMPPGRIRVIYNGVDYNKFLNRETAKANGYGELKARNLRGKKVVLFLGRLTEQKGPMQFLHAAKVVLEKQDALFVVAGKGNMLPLLINLAINLGINNRVMFLGFVPEEEQRKIYAMADVYIMPSVSEPFGITALEAMASGTPVILSKEAGVSEIVKNALKVDFWDINGLAAKILGVLRYEVLANHMSRLELEEVKKFTWADTADKTRMVYS
ncbi:hypothetical protein COX84_01735, partial [Candidatus Micrarchaeota archaeon CG_4_10_14_0_2_um_filter_49_7]